MDIFKNLNNNEGGFTLIELMVVIAIIGILSATTLPKLTGGVQNSTYNTALKTSIGSKMKQGMGMAYANTGVYPSPSSDYASIVTDLEDYVSLPSSDLIDDNGEDGIEEGNYALEENDVAITTDSNNQFYLIKLPSSKREGNNSTNDPTATIWVGDRGVIKIKENTGASVSTSDRDKVTDDPTLFDSI